MGARPSRRVAAPAVPATHAGAGATPATTPAVSVQASRHADDVAGRHQATPPSPRPGERATPSLVQWAAAGYVERPRISAQLQAWATRGSGSVCALVGPPGSGKTSILAAEALSSAPDSLRVIAYHLCCSARPWDTADPARFVASLAAQLEWSLNALGVRYTRPAAVDQLADASVSPEVVLVAVLASLPRVLPDTSPSSSPRARPHIVIIDALDEAPAVAQVLGASYASAPVWLRFLLSCESLTYLELVDLPAATAAVVSSVVVPSDSADAAGFLAFLRPRMQEAFPRDVVSDAAVTAMAVACAWNYLTAVLALAARHPSHSLRAWRAALPSPLSHSVLLAMLMRRYPAFQSLASTLSVAQAPLPASLCRLISPRLDLADAHALQPLLVQYQDQSLSLAHSVCLRWRQTSGESAPLAHAQLARIGIDLLAKGNLNLDVYLRRFLVHHLALAPAMRSDLLATLTDPAWLTARLAHGKVHGLCSDLSVAGEPALRAMAQHIWQIAPMLAQHADALLFHVVLAVDHKDPLAASLVDRTRAYLARAPRVTGDPSLLPSFGTAPNDSLRAMMTGHAHAITSVAVLGPDHIASAGDDGVAVVWRVSSRSLQRVLIGHTDRILALCAVPTRRALAGAGGEHHEGDHHHHHSDGGGRDVDEYAACLDLASGCVDGSIRVWSVATGATRLHVDGAAAVTAVCCVADRFLAAGDYAGDVRLFRLADGQALATLKQHQAPVQALTLLRQPDLLASLSADHTLAVWRRDGTLLASCSTGDGTGYMARVDEATLVTAGSDDKLRFWRATDAQLLYEWTLPTSGWITAVAAVTPDIVAAGVQDGRVLMIAWRTGQRVGELAAHRNRVSAMCVSQHSHDLVTASSDASVRVWAPHLSPGVRTSTAIGTVCHADLVLCAAAMDAGAGALSQAAVAVTASWGGAVHRWDPASGLAVAPVVAAPRRCITALAVLAATTVVLADTNGRVHVLAPDAPARTLPLRIDGDVRVVIPMPAYAPDDDAVVALAGHRFRLTIASLCDAGRVLATAEPVPSHSDAVLCGVRVDATTLIVGACDGNLSVWDLSPGCSPQMVRVLRDGHSGKYVLCVAALGRSRLVSGSQDNLVTVWDWCTGTPLRQYLGHTGALTALAVLPCRTSIVASAAWDGSLHLWDPANLRVVQVIPLAGRLIRSLAVCAGHLVCGLHSGHVMSLAVQ